MEIRYDLNRLIKIIDDFKEMELVEKWGDLSEERKNKEKKNQINMEDDMYNISQRGISKLEKLERDCLDDFERILRVKIK